VNCTANGIKSLLVESDERLNCSIMSFSLSAARTANENPDQDCNRSLNGAPKLADADKALAIIKALQTTQLLLIRLSRITALLAVCQLVPKLRVATTLPALFFCHQAMRHTYDFRALSERRRSLSKRLQKTAVLGSRPFQARTSIWRDRI